VTIRFGASPIAWINDDMPELGGDTPLEKVLQDIREVGFAGVELGGKFPRDPTRLRGLLDSYDLDLIGGWYSANLLTRSADAEISALREHLELLQALGCSVFVIAETSNAIHGRRDTPLRDSPVLDAEQWKVFGERMTTVADYVDRHGLRFAYHFHLGTVVETADELDKFLTHTGPTVGLTLDTGHGALGGIDVLGTLRQSPERIAHVHCKDVRQGLFQKIMTSGGSFLDGVVEGMFTVPGDGDLNFHPVLESLAGMDYSGWVVVEAEQDPAIADPRVYAQLGLDALRHHAGLAGLKEAA